MARICFPDRRWVVIVFALLFSGAKAASPEHAAVAQATELCEHNDWPRAEAFLRAALDRFGANDDDNAWELRLLYARALTGQAKHESAAAVLGVNLPPQLAHSAIAVRRLLALAELEIRKPRADVSNPLLRADNLLHEAETLARSDHPLLLSDVFFHRAALEYVRPNQDASERYARDAIRLARRHHQRVVEANALATLARLCTSQRRYREAVDLDRQALGLAEELGSPSKIAKVSGNLGWALKDVGDFEEARDYLKSSVAIAEKIGSRTDMVPALHNLGDIALHDRDPAAALSYYAKGLAIAREINHADLGEFVANMADAQVSVGDLASARIMNNEALARVRAAKKPEEELRSLLIDARIDAAAGQLDTAITKATHIVDVWQTSPQRWEAEARLADFYVAANNPAQAEKYFRRAVETSAEARRKVISEELRLPFGALVRELYDRYVAFLLATGRRDDALNAAEQSRAQTLEEALGEDTTEPRGDLKRVAQEHGAVILAYWLAPARSYVWTITSTSIAVDVLKPSGEIESAVERYAGDLTGPMAGSGSAPQGEKLYAMLLPAAAKRLHGGQRVIVIPDGRLHAFNMETLVDPISHHYWIEDVTLETASSIDLLNRPRTEDASKSMLIIGDPPSPDPQFPRLAHAAEEVTRIQQQFKSCVVLTGAAATPSAYARAAPERYGIVHFVAHGVATRLRPLESAVILAREGESYKLYARDIVRKRLHARLVTISSCHGAGTRAYTGEGLVGLAWAFLHAGARQVIAALWEVNDSATPALMSDLYAGIRRGDDPAVALRAAKLKLVRGTNVDRLPRYWAPFVLYSGS
jgi:CHAT domain-containing protein/Tfp pilus assembly protein PilF